MLEGVDYEYYLANEDCALLHILIIILVRVGFEGIQNISIQNKNKMKIVVCVLYLYLK